MTESTTLVAVSPSTARSGERPENPPPELTAAEQDAVRELIRQARASGTALTSPGGLLKQLTKMVVEAALDEEMSEHLGYDKGDHAGRNRGNARHGKRSKTVITDNAGPVEIEVPRDREGTFEPVIVAKRARRLSDLDAVVLSLSAKGLTQGEISAHFADVSGASVVAGHRLAHHRPGHRGDDDVVGSPVGERVRGGVHRRGHGEGARRTGPQQAHLCRHRGRPGRAQGHPGDVGRRW
jgi:hypothetical protein